MKKLRALDVAVGSSGDVFSAKAAARDLTCKD